MLIICETLDYLKEDGILYTEKDIKEDFQSRNSTNPSAC